MFEKEIQAGVELLNENYLNWLDHIDLNELNLGSCQHCIIGQLEREYATDCGYDPNLGFDVNYEFYYNNEAEEYLDILTTEWKETINNLRNNENN